MNRIEFEYKGSQYSFGHKIEHIDKIYYLVVYTTDNYSYIEKYFSDIISALDFEPESIKDKNCFKLTFVYILSTDELDGEIYYDWFQISFLNQKVKMNIRRTEWYKQTINFSFTCYDYNFCVRLRDLDEVGIGKDRINKNNSKVRIFFKNIEIRLIQNTDNSIDYFSNEKYYEFVPVFESATNTIFLEILFLFDIMIKNYEIDEFQKILCKLKIAKKMTEDKINLANEPVVVIGNKKGGVVEVMVPENEHDNKIFHIMLRQGDRYCHVLGDMGFLSEVEYFPGEILKSGRILIQEQFEPIKPEDPSLHLKMKDGKACRKEGKLIYHRKYFTCNKTKNDIIIEED